MKFGTLLKLLFVTLLLGVLAYFVIDRYRMELDRNAKAAAGALLLPNLEVNKVAKIVLRSPRGETHLHLKDGIWYVRERADYYARTDIVNFLLYALANARITEIIPVPAEQLDRLGLALPPLDITPVTSRGVSKTVEFPLSIECLDVNGQPLSPTLVAGVPIYPKDMENPVAKLLGRNYLVARAPYDVCLSSQTLAETSARPFTWLDKSFPPITQLNGIALTFPDSPAMSWRMARIDAAMPFQLLDAPESGHFDIENADTASFFLQALTFEDVRPHKEAQFARAPILEAVDGHHTYRFRINDTGERYIWVHLTVLYNGKPVAQYAHHSAWDYCFPRTQFARILKPKSAWLLDSDSMFFTPDTAK